jgi:hypothetical protein
MRKQVRNHERRQGKIGVELFSRGCSGESGATLWEESDHLVGVGWEEVFLVLWLGDVVDQGRWSCQEWWVGEEEGSL